MPESEELQVGWFGKAWIVAVTAYAVVRALVAWPTLSRFGVNPWIFLAIDIGTAYPYALGQAKMVKGFRVRRYDVAQVWGVVVLVTFLAPYAYIVGAGRGEIPLWAYAIIALFVVGVAVATILRLAQEVRTGREGTAGPPEGGRPADPVVQPPPP